jgi:hypothetical protein
MPSEIMFDAFKIIVFSIASASLLCKENSMGLLTKSDYLFHVEIADKSRTMASQFHFPQE